MDDTQFVALGASRLRPRIAQAERDGWVARLTRNAQLEAAGVTGRQVLLEHPDAPYPIILCRGDSDLRLTAVRRNSKGGFAWVELVDDRNTTDEVVDDAPVVAALIAVLDRMDQVNGSGNGA